MQKSKLHPIVIEKIGGTSMSQFHKVLQNIILNKESYQTLTSIPPFPYGRLFVVSAYSGITNLLLEHKKTKKPGIYQQFLNQKDYEKSLEKLLENLKTINTFLEPLGLDLKIANTFIEARVSKTAKMLRDLANVFASGYVLQENISLATREILASIGEAHAAFNSANITNAHKINSCFIDLSGLNDNLPLTTEDRIKRSLKTFNPFKTLPFITGYVKGVEGIMRKFDRGYSEITFSKLAVLLKASEAIIHKEYHLSSADPKIVQEKNAIPIGLTNYDVADQLADVGMEAIHPHASKPLEKKNINLRVKNTFDPTHPGTLITKSYRGDKAKVEVITGSNQVSLVEIHDPDMVGSVGFDFKICQAFLQHKVSYILKSTNANTISIIIWDKHATPSFFQTLQKNFPGVKKFEKVAIVSMIGSNIGVPGVLANCASALAKTKINVKCISQANREVNMQFVIHRSNYNKAIIALNQNLILNKTPYEPRN